MSSVGAVVLAAGEGSRFGGPKQAVLLPSVLDRVRATGLAPVVVVEGAHSLTALELGASADVTLVRCPDWALGPGASLRCGLAALAEDVVAAVVLLADGPDLAPEAVARVVAAWRASGAPVVAASYGGRRGHPLLVARTAWQAVPDAGLREVTPALVACDDLGEPGDVDRPEDLPPRLAG